MKPHLRFIIPFFLTVSTVLAQSNFKQIYISRIGVTWQNHFYIIYANENGNAVALKGEFKMLDNKPVYGKTKVSKTFKIKDIGNYFARLRMLSANTLTDQTPISESPCIEVYFNGRKIYHSSYMTNRSMELQRPLMTALPYGFNYFRNEANNPFFANTISR